MFVFDYLEFDKYEYVVFCYDEVSGLKVIIVIYNMNFGLLLGGCCMWLYLNSVEVLIDVFCFFKGMMYKVVMVNLKQGGGKLVIIGDLCKNKMEDMMKVMGCFVESFNGCYIIVEDLGISVENLQVMVIQLLYIVGMLVQYNVLGEMLIGNLVLLMVYGVFVGLKVMV